MRSDRITFDLMGTRHILSPVPERHPIAPAGRWWPEDDERMYAGAAEAAVDARGSTWGVILAGGSGTRLSALTTDADGTVIPKQYCSFLGGPSLLRTTIERLGRVVARDRIVIVVAAAHRRWWGPELADLPPDNVIVQPWDRGTACGVLLPLTSILHRDPSARIVVSPSDNYIRDEETFIVSLLEAQAHVDSRPGLLVLLGMEPDHPDTGYGWITSSQAGEDAVSLVTSFVEKPDAELANRLMRSGALWSSFTFVATGETLMDQFRRSMPWLVERFSFGLSFDPWERRQDALLSLYDRLPNVDFSRRVLQHADEKVYVLPVPPCGWTDLGTPRRVSDCAMRHACADCIGDGVAGCLHERHDGARPPDHHHFRSGPVDLAEVALRDLSPDYS